MDISQTSAAVDVGRTKAASNLLHEIFNLNRDSGVEALQEANSHGVKDLTKDKGRF